MSEQMRSYGVARRLFSALEFFGWVVIVGGVIAGYILAASAGSYVSDEQRILLFLTGASTSVLGLFLIGAVQNWRAGVDSAEYNQQMLKVARDQLAVSRQALKQGVTQPRGFATKAQDSSPVDRPSFATAELKASPKPQSSPTPQLQSEPAETIDYKGKTIVIRNGTYAYNTLRFDTLEEAQAYIDRPRMRSLPEPFQTPE